jgi:penicillin-binding protein 1C
MKLRSIVIVALGGGFAVAGIFAEVCIRKAHIPEGARRNPMPTTLVTDMRGRELGVLATSSARDCRPVALREMGAWLPVVTVALEDRRFWSHAGVDFTAVAASLWRNARAGRIVGGGSTITQQLVKIASGTPPRTVPNKLDEARTAILLERIADKEEILVHYLNRLDYGNRRIGPDAAARAYFGKPASALSFAEAVFLAGLPRSPTRLNPWNNLEPALELYRRNVLRLERMRTLPEGITAGMLTAAPPVTSQNPPADEAPHFVREVARRARNTLPEPPATLATTLDIELQKKVRLLANTHRSSVPELQGADMAVVVVDVAGGEVRAFVSVGESDGFSAPLTPRSAGSTLKPFLYAQAIGERVFTAASLLPDTPDAPRRAFADYDPRNFSHRYLGPVRLREALANSLNVPAVYVLARLGARRSFAAIQAWGFEFSGGFDRSGAGFILGNVAVTPLELAGAYASLARGGRACSPVVLPSGRREVLRVADPAACAVISDILCDNEARMRTFGRASSLAMKTRAAAKTGTSSGFRDAWCAGFTGSHAVVVWVGRMDGRPLPGTLAVRTAAPLWASVVRMLMEGGDSAVPEPMESAELVSTRVCRLTGLLPDASQPSLREWFLPGTEPAEPAASLLKNGQLVLPSDYAAWCAGPHNHLNATTRTRSLEILYPTPNATFLLTPALPAGRQAIVPTSSDVRASWFLNGEHLPASTIPLKAGTHTLEARLPGESASVTFTVEE